MTSDRLRGAAARIRALPPCLLVAVALTQIAAATTGPLSPWLGGGFGMFATTDSPARRHLHAVALREGMRQELDLPVDLVREARRTVGFPSQRRLRALARELAAIEAEEGDPDAAPLEEIAITVFRAHYDRDTLAPTGELIASLRVPAGDE